MLELRHQIKRHNKLYVEEVWKEGFTISIRSNDEELVWTISDSEPYYKLLNSLDRYGPLCGKVENVEIDVSNMSKRIHSGDSSVTHEEPQNPQVVLSQEGRMVNLKLTYDSNTAHEFKLRKSEVKGLQIALYRYIYRR